MMIDLSTIQSLELIQNTQNTKSKECLFGLMNRVITPMGSRLLRSSILQPSTQTEVLQSRYAAVNDLATKEEMFFQIRKGSAPSNLRAIIFTNVSGSALKPVMDVEKLLSMASCTTPGTIWKALTRQS